MIQQDATNVFIEEPMMLVIEEKRTAELDRVDSKAQLAQIRQLQVQK